jgi:hypothetical protein
MTISPAFQKTLKGILYTEEEERCTILRAQERINFTGRVDEQKRNGKELNIILVNQQTFKMKKGEIDTYLSKINLMQTVLLPQLKDTDWLNGFKKIRSKCLLPVRNSPHWQKHTHTEKERMINHIPNKQNPKGSRNSYTFLTK